MQFAPATVLAQPQLVESSLEGGKVLETPSTDTRRGAASPVAIQPEDRDGNGDGDDDALAVAAVLAGLTLVRRRRSGSTG